MTGLLDLLPEALLRHAPALVVLVPLLTAPVLVLFNSSRLAWTISFIAGFFTALFAVVLVIQTSTGLVLTYDMGGWASPYGIVYKIDGLSAAIVLLIAVMGFITLAYAPGSVAREVDKDKHSLFYSAFLVCFAGLIGCVTTNDAFNLFVFLEISSLATYVLVGMGGRQDRRALTSAYNYLMLGTIGATFFVIGVGFLYMGTGTLNMDDMAIRIQEVGVNRVIEAGFAFIVVGLGLKLAMYPLHSWLPGAYTFAPNFVTAFLAATATKMAYYALIRFLYTVFGPSYEFHGLTLIYLFAPLAVLGMLVCSFQAIFQNNVKRLFAISSVAQVGYMLLGLSFGTAAGLAAGILHAINHGLMKGALFVAIGIFMAQIGCRTVQDFKGIGRLMPVSMSAFTIAGLSLVGVPLTAGFVSKYYLLTATLERGWWPVAVAIVVASVLAFIYVGRVLEKAWLHEPPKNARGEVMVPGKPPYAMVGVLIILAGANIWFGVDASLTTTLACQAAGAVFPGADPACLAGMGK
jgi:multicomponent Na+:H+ antiporter subunit D